MRAHTQVNQPLTATGLCVVRTSMPCNPLGVCSFMAISLKYWSSMYVCTYIHISWLYYTYKCTYVCITNIYIRMYVSKGNIWMVGIHTLLYVVTGVQWWSRTHMFFIGTPTWKVTHNYFKQKKLHTITSAQWSATVPARPVKWYVVMYICNLCTYMSHYCYQWATIC